MAQYMFRSFVPPSELAFAAISNPAPRVRAEIGSLASHGGRQNELPHKQGRACGALAECEVIHPDVCALVSHGPGLA